MKVELESPVTVVSACLHVENPGHDATSVEDRLYHHDSTGMDGHVSVLNLLDLSGSFDTTDQTILLNRLENLY